MTKSATRVAADKVTFTQAEVTSAVTAGDTAARAGRKNLIINGSAMVSQRGSYTSATSIQNASYFLDRFRFQNSVVTGTVQHTSISLNGVNKKAIKVAATSTGTGYLILQQTVEFESIQVGENYTVSCWVRSNNANTRFRQNTFRATSEDGTAFTNDGNWEKVSWTFSSTGTTGSPTINIAMYNNANVSISNGDYFEITELQLETGSVATDFEHRSYGEELALCLRYFYKPAPLDFSAQGTHWSGNNGYMTFNFPVPMRAKPSYADSGSSTYKTYYNGIQRVNGGQLGDGGGTHTEIILLNSNSNSPSTFVRLDGSDKFCSFDAEL